MAVEMTLLPPQPEISLAPRRSGFWRWALSRIRAYSRVRPPPAGDHAEQAAYGFAQPILGARVLLADLELLREALVPAGVLGLACALWASLNGGDHGWAVRFYHAFAALAPLPSFIFANHYARLAALIRWRMGLGACGPREMPLRILAMRMIRQALIVAIGLAPVLLVAELLPGIGDLLRNLALAAWGLHWVVADAFDDAQVCAPGESLRESLQHDRNAPSPWFVRWMLRGASHLGFFGAPLRWFARICDKLAIDSRGEIATIENNRSLSAGFAVATAALLATPVLNLLFRPIIIAGSTHLLGQLEHEEHAPEPAPLPPPASAG